MNVPSVNLEKVTFDIDNILSDIKNVLEEKQPNNINIPDVKVNTKEYENACKIFGAGNDK